MTTDDMRLKKISIAAALTLALASHYARADELSATERCFELISRDEVVDEAVTVCAAAAKESRDGLVLYGDILSWQDNVQAAIEHYSKALEGIDLSTPDETTVAALRRRAVEYYALDRQALAYKDAVAYLRHAPDDDEMLFVAAKTAPSPQEGLPYIERAIGVKPEDIVQYGLHAQLLLALGKNKEAHATADKALKIAPKDPKSVKIKALVHATSGEHAKAERLYAQVVRMSPNDAGAKVSHADSLISLKRYENAIEVASAAVREHPSYPEAWGLRALAHLGMGDGAAALADIAKVKELRPTWDVSTHETRARKLAQIHETLSPAGLAKIEADRQLAIKGITRHLHSQCSDYRVPEFSPDLDTDEVNAELDRYRNCFRTWLKISDIEIYDSLTPTEVAAGERLYDAKTLMFDAGDLRCSAMPKRSKCLTDETLARATTLLEDVEDLFTFVRNTEVRRFNDGMASLNKAIERYNRGVEFRGFLHALGEALNE
jgi:tetratricopeptide (TPR) repeat protein